jgi:hypothetical protein
MGEDEEGYELLVVLATREEAEVVASALRADGVDAFVEPTTHAGFGWFYALALGGEKVFVERGRREESRELLRERLRENADAHPEERVGRRDHWKIWLVVVMTYGFNWLWMIIVSWDWPESDKYRFYEWVNGITYAPLSHR